MWAEGRRAIVVAVSVLPSMATVGDDSTDTGARTVVVSDAWAMASTMRFASARATRSGSKPSSEAATMSPAWFASIANDPFTSVTSNCMTASPSSNWMMTPGNGNPVWSKTVPRTACAASTNGANTVRRQIRRAASASPALNAAKPAPEYSDRSVDWHSIEEAKRASSFWPPAASRRKPCVGGIAGATRLQVSRALGQPFESVWSRAQSVIRHDDRDVVGTPSGEGQVDQFLALLSWAAPRRQSLGNLTFRDEVSETIRGEKQAIA